MLAAGCGDDSHPANQPDASIDAAPDAPDYGAPSTTYPAFMPDMPQIVNQGGPVIQNMKIVTVSWTSDPHLADHEAFADGLGASNYWHAATSEYGIGLTASTATEHVHIVTAPPATMTDTDLTNLITTSVQSSSSGWPAPTASTAYIVYTDPTTVVNSGGNVCTRGISAYYDQLTVGGVKFPYSVVLGCFTGAPSYAASSMVDSIAANPVSHDQPAYEGFDTDHFAWGLMMYFGGSIGLACETFTVYQFQDSEPGFQFQLARAWSNQSALAGHNPCVPLPPGPYFNVTPFPDQQDTIAVDGVVVGQNVSQTKGYKAQMGQPRTFQVGFYSDQHTPAPIQISAVLPPNVPYVGGASVPNGSAMVSIDKTSGVNGEKAYVTVTPTAFNSMGIIYLEISSRTVTSATRNTLPILIGQ
jgi:hypothetical protein